jgi:uncharacterized protein
MNNQEREVIADIFKRLEQVAHQPRDPEAERLIAERLRAQPYAPYAMAQAIFVQEQALTNLNGRVQQLEAELAEARRGSRSSGGLLGSLFGGGSREPERPAPGRFGQSGPGMGGPGMSGPGLGGRPGPWGGAQGSPWGGQPAGMMGQPGFGAQRGGSGFLGTAMATAAGVAGGMMLGSALSNAFGGGSEGAGQGLFGGGDAAQANAGGQDAADLSPFGQSGDNAGDNAGFQDASYDPTEDFGSDFGGDGGGDWA